MKVKPKIIETLSLLAITLSFAVIAYNNKFVFGQDSLTYHLQISRYIANYNAIPKRVPYDLYYREFEKPPLLYFFTYPFFKLFGASEKTAEIVPLTLQFTFLLFMWSWLKREGAHFSLYLLSLLISIYLVDLLAWYYQACVVVLFSAISFYYFIRFLDSYKERDLLMLALFSSFAMLSKITGVVVLPFFIIAYLFYIHSQTSLKKTIAITIISFIALLPSAMWYITHHTTNHMPTHINAIATNDLSERLAILTLHFEFIVMAGVVLGFYDRLKPSERLLFFIAVPLIALIIYKGGELRYVAVFMPLAIYFIAKYLSKLPFSPTFHKALMVGILAIFITNPFFNFFNPQHNKQYQLTNIKMACDYLIANYGRDKFVVGDADFGIGWWCKYNFTSLRDYLSNINRYPKPDFVVDCWYNFCNHPHQNYCEYDDLEKVKTLCKEFELVWSDNYSYIYRCG